MRRLISHAPDHQLAADVLCTPVVRNGVTFRESLPPGPQRDAAIARNLEDFARRAEPLEARATELRELLIGHDPIGVILGIVVPSGMGVPGGDDAPSTVMWSAQVEYLVGLAVSAPAGTDEAPVEAIRQAGKLLQSVFDAARARHMHESWAMQRTGVDAPAATLFMLRGEHLFDRMDGYAVHVAAIDAEVFDRHRDAYVNAVGFNPADVHRVVRDMARAGNERFHRARDLFAECRDVDDQQAVQALADLLDSVDASRIWVPDEVAATTRVDVAEISAMLTCFSTAFDAQPEFRLPTDPNVARTHPVISRGDGSYLVADPWALTGAVHLRFAELEQVGGASFPRYRRHREQGHQRVVTEAFTRVFGTAVKEGQHYASEADGPGEIDTLVCSSWPVIVESKAHGLTPAGRRGAPARVETKTKDILVESSTQTARAHRYVVDDGGRQFSPTAKATPEVLLPERIDGATDVVVTFERMDPLAMFAQGLTGEPGRPVWVVSAADLLVVVDVLDDPAALHHYIRTRAATAAAGMVVYMESDALSGYLTDRLAPQLDLAATDPDANVVLGYSSTAINEYFTLVELGQDADRPTAGVPPGVTAALAATFHARALGWVAAVDAVMAASPPVWSKWQRFLRRHRGKARPFELAPHVRLVTADEPALVPDDGSIELHVRT